MMAWGNNTGFYTEELNEENGVTAGHRMNGNETPGARRVVGIQEALVELN